MKLQILLMIAAWWFSEYAQSVELIVPCSKQFCEKYLENNVCPALGKNCDVQEPNFKGVELPFTGPCNCCPYCLEHLELGDDCPIGEANSIVPVSLCGPGLICVQDTVTKLKKCQTMANTKCAKELEQYDIDVEQGNVGNLQQRPNCDASGQYDTFKCIPGEICYCVDEDGSRIFGEIPYSSLAARTLKCGCSRHNARAARFVDGFANTWTQMRCNQDGSFDAIQCLSTGCLCVDKLDGRPTYPGSALVKPVEISNTSMPCFDNTTHVAFDYFRGCEDIYRRNYEDDQKYIADGYDPYGSLYSTCQMDGHYAPVQVRQDNNYMYCADRNGKQLGDYQVAVGDQLSHDMNCKCARANVLIVGLDKPMCRQNGNYEPLQCKRGECRCVDDDGNQIEKEVEYDSQGKLSCFQPSEVQD